MNLKTTILLKLIVAFNISIFCNAVNGQTEKSGIPENAKDSLKRYLLFNVSPVFQPYFKNSYELDLVGPFSRNTQLPQLFGTKNRINSFSFGQKKSESVLTGLGSYQHFTNHLNIKRKKFAFDFGIGFANQNTVLMSQSIYQFSFRASAEYKLASWISGYLYGQYISKPINRPADFFDPFMHRNPLFLQPEIGAGLKTNFKKVNADFQIFSIYGTELDNISPVNSRLRIGF